MYVCQVEKGTLMLSVEILLEMWLYRHSGKRVKRAHPESLFFDPGVVTAFLPRMTYK